MDNPTKASRGPKIALMGGIAVLAIVAIVYFSFFYPPAKTEDVSGTIGAAKKYRSEQITDKDVKLEGQSSDALATGESIVDVQAANEFAATAKEFERTFRALDAQVKLDATARDTYQRAAIQLNSIASALARTPKNSYDARAVAELRSSAAELERSAAAVVAAKAKTLDRAATMDMRTKLETMDARAIQMNARMTAVMENKTTLDSRPAAMDNQAKIDAKAQADKAKDLNNKAE